MITPTGRAILLAAAGAPFALLLTVLQPASWAFGLVWPVLIIALITADGLLAGSGRDIRAALEAPLSRGMGAGAFPIRLHLGGRARRLEVALEGAPNLRVTAARATADVSGEQGEVAFEVEPKRRGDARFSVAHLRWRGPLGLAWRQRNAPLDAGTAVTPDLDAIENVAERLFSRTFMHGIKPLRDRGDGSEFDALAKFETGMDRRLIDWKQSARHQMLLAKEVRAERNHQLAFALDTGRLMCEPVRGTPRIDWALNAALMLAYVGLKLGDRVSVFGFDARPNLATGLVSGPRAFEQLKLLTAKIDYSADETNHTFGLATLAERLQRRSMVVVFTDFADTTSAELMIDTMSRLARKHLVLFVAFRDEELESLVDARPESPEDVSRAVVASGLLRERDLVVARLRRLGVHIVTAPADKLGPELIAAYDSLRRSERI